MSKISILDCTLRDGGYINSWQFGKESIQTITDLLEKSKIDIIECGFIEEGNNDPDCSLYPNVSSMSKIIKKNKSALYVGMIALGDIDINKIENHQKNFIDGIRLSFHKHEIDEEIKYAKILINKGYKVFIQPVGMISYTDKEILNLVSRINEIDPYAFYIVDTLGTMYPSDIQKLFSIVDNNLNPNISLGFHSHNNLQLSFSNALTFLSCSSKRNKIIDSSVFGMGRGAGNLPTELITQYINNNYEYKYDVVPLLTIMDEYLNPIYTKTPWGYSSPYYLSAINLCHPNYANYLMKKKTISVETISKIINLIPASDRAIYNKDLIEKIYFNYQSSIIDDRKDIKEIKKIVNDKEILLIAPGTSIKTEKEKITKWIENNNGFVIHINSIFSDYPANMLFVSNSLKAKKLSSLNTKNVKIVSTSNIPTDLIKTGYRINYTKLLGNNSEIDNAGLMCLTMLNNIGVKKVSLAGFDGFGNESDYITKVTSSYMSNDSEIRNKEISDEISRLSNEMNIHFITKSLYDVRNK